MNEIYKKITTIKLNKLKFKKVLKNHIFSQKLIFHSLKKIYKKSRFFFNFRSHERSELPER